MAYMNYFESGMSDSTNEVVHTGEYSCDLYLRLRAR